MPILSHVANITIFYNNMLNIVARRPCLCHNNYRKSSLTSPCICSYTFQNGEIMLHGSNFVVVFYEAIQTTFNCTRIGRVGDALDLKAVPVL